MHENFEHGASVIAAARRHQVVEQQRQVSGPQAGREARKGECLAALLGAHVGGLIGGLVLMWLFHRFQRSPALYTVGATVAVIAASVVIAYAKARNLQ